MLTLSKILISIACPIIVIDQALNIKMITMPMPWTIIAGPVMTALLGIGLVLFALKSPAFRK